MLSFSVSGLYEGLFVMQDDATGSQWLHYTGECVTGPLAGAQLEMLPSEILPFGTLRDAAPHATVTAPTNALWRRVVGWFEAYVAPPILPGMFRRTMSDEDRRLPRNTLGLGVVHGRRNLVHGQTAIARFYPMDTVNRARLVVDRVGPQPILVAAEPSGGAPVAFLLPHDDFAVEGDHAVDRRTGGRWDVLGHDDTGRRLPIAVAIFGRWYGFSQTYRDASIAVD